MACQHTLLPSPGQVVSVQIATALLPKVGRFSTVVWIPRRQKPIAAQVMLHQLHIAAATSTLPHSETIAHQHNILYHLPQLLFRKTTADEEDMAVDEDPAKPTPFRELIEKRLERALAGDWSSLVQDLWDDIAEHDEKPPRRPRPLPLPLGA